jgi:hypothetical protein
VNVNRFRRRLIEADDSSGRPRLAEYAIIIAVIAMIAFGALILTGSQTSMILSAVSGSV